MGATAVAHKCGKPQERLAAHKCGKPQELLSTSHVNELEVVDANAVIEVLEELIPGDHILSLAAYKLHSHSLKHGSNVQGAQGASRNVVLYSVCVYGCKKLSTDGHILNTAEFHSCRSQ